MASDLPIYRDGKRILVTRRAYDRIYNARGWRMRPPKGTTTSSSTDGDQTGTEPTDQEG